MVRSEEIVARSESMRRVVMLAERVADSDAPVLVSGESGCGKERIVRLIHERSRRAGGPFVAVNCGALPDGLLEGELFGHVRGAFTGADRDREGLFEAASGGIVLLDEIGELPQHLQVKLLRVLQDGEVRRVGATRSRAVDARVVAATNRDLADMVAAKAFRKDLYYRLNVLRIDIPPLRQRREDVLPLAQSFLRRGCARYRCGPCSLSAEALDALLEYSWPGNVRELEHAMERAVVLAEGKPKIEATDLPPEIVGRPAPLIVDMLVEPLAEIERRHILLALERCGGNRSKTAKALGIGTNTLWRKLRAYSIASR